MSIQSITVTTISQYLEEIRRATASWYFPTGSSPWFRGQSNGSKEPLPGIFRTPAKEHDLTTFFMQRAGMYTRERLPTSLAQWLSLMQHVGLPTRLLDWTDGALVGLYFALHPSEDKDAAVWMMDPIELNKHSSVQNLPASHLEPVKSSYELAFGGQSPASPPRYPIAVFPTQVHQRMAGQRGLFTIHGTDRGSFVAQFDNHKLSIDGRLIKFDIPAAARGPLKKDLHLLGIKHAALFPDLEGLATELKETFSY